MENVFNAQEIENQVFQVDSKDFKSMMLGTDGITIMGKRAKDASEFWAVFEKAGLLNVRAKIAPEELKNITVEQGEKKISLSYKKTLPMGVPGELEFSSEADMNNAFAYMQKKWGYQRTEKQLSPMKATVPYLLGLLLTIAATGYIVHLITHGGEVRVNVILLLLIKIGEKLGPIGTIVAGIVLSLLICRMTWKAYKNPPVEVRLEPITL